MQRTEREIHHLLLYDCAGVAPFGQPRNDYTDRHDVMISLVIMKNRTYLSRPLQGIFKRNVHSLSLFVDNFVFATKKAFDVCIRM